MLQQIVVDRVLEFVDAGVAATADAFCRDLGEETLDGLCQVVNAKLSLSVNNLTKPFYLLKKRGQEYPDGLSPLVLKRHKTRNTSPSSSRLT